MSVRCRVVVLCALFLAGLALTACEVTNDAIFEADLVLSGGVPITARKNLAIGSSGANHIWIDVKWNPDPPTTDTSVTLCYFAFDFSDPNNPVAVPLRDVLLGPSGTTDPPPPVVTKPVPANSLETRDNVFTRNDLTRTYRVVVTASAEFGGHRRWAAGWFEARP